MEDASGQPSDAILRGSGDAARRRALNILDRFQGIPTSSIKMADVPPVSYTHLDVYKRQVPFFEKHPLKSKKRVDFAKFRRVLQLISLSLIHI